MAAEKGRWEVCVKLAELGADLNKANNVSEACFNCMSLSFVTLALFSELVWRDGLDVGC